MIVLPLLVKFSHVHQTVLHLLQAPDLFASAPPSNLNGRFAEHRVPLQRKHAEINELQEDARRRGPVKGFIVKRETLRFALRLSDGICRVTLYSVWRSSSSEMKHASCTRRFALTICSLSLRRLLTKTTSLGEDGRRESS